MKIESNLKKDFSFGIVPVNTLPNDKFEVFIIQHISGHWGFPKGHADEGENPIETAVRELREETSLEINETLMSDEILTEQYSFRSGKAVVLKKVQYYIGSVCNPDNYEIDRSEAIEGKWVEINEAPRFLTYEEGRRICREAAQILQV